MEDPGQDVGRSPRPPKGELSPGSRGQSGCRGSSRSTSSSPDRKSTSSVSSPGAPAIASSSISSGKVTHPAQPPPPAWVQSEGGGGSGWVACAGLPLWAGELVPEAASSVVRLCLMGPGPRRPRDDSPFQFHCWAKHF
uniref:Uncharacterized protein n=1 Tax=Myotis myotis TaxID=51298 RepID=A0A7J8AM29_MYOMY|nr:hypothetical protein mMyoMyo1_007990 [Myotis myotis]